MRRTLLALTVIAFALSPATSQAGEGAGQVMKDSWVTTKTKMAFVKDDRVKARRVTVETQDGVVTLRGKVATTDERSAAEEIARGIDGAASISNALQVVPEDQRTSVDAKDDELEKAVKARLEKDDRLKEAGIEVRADNSVVTLMGKVADPKIKTRAADVARGVPGVKAVRNELAQKS